MTVIIRIFDTNVKNYFKNLHSKISMVYIYFIFL
nr:MAG TPA: hypothetical protein [Bacteriophage sp.]